jgi:phospholipid transport system substrate-binding protein
VGGKWLVYDVVIENVSMVRNYRTQFSRIINKSSYEGLVQAIERKLKELNVSPSS